MSKNIFSKISENISKRTCGVANFDLLVPLKKEELDESIDREVVGLRDLHVIILKEDNCNVYNAINLDFNLTSSGKSIQEALDNVIEEIWECYVDDLNHTIDMNRIDFDILESYWPEFNRLINIARNIEQRQNRKIINNNKLLRNRILETQPCDLNNFDNNTIDISSEFNIINLNTSVSQKFQKKGILLIKIAA